MNLSNRLLAGAHVGPYADSEHEGAKDLWQLIPPNSVTIIDRGFMNYMTFLELVSGADNRHFLIRAKSNTAFEAVKLLPDGSLLALLHPNTFLLHQQPDVPGPIEVRVIDYQHEGGKPGRLITTLTDWKKWFFRHCNGWEL